MSKHALLFAKHDRNARWFDAHYDELAQRYEDEFVAVYQGKVVDHGRSMSHLMKRVAKKYPRQEVYVEYVTRRKLQFVL